MTSHIVHDHQREGQPARCASISVEGPSAAATLWGMVVQSHDVEIRTGGNSQVINITEHVCACIRSGDASAGIATVFVVGSTAGITTTEFEPGLAQHDLRAAFDRLAPETQTYRHEETWHDDNGHSHVRASLLGASLTVPFNDRELQLGTWQQIVLIDFDTRPRTRRIIVQVVGE